MSKLEHRARLTIFDGSRDMLVVHDACYLNVYQSVVAMVEFTRSMKDPVVFHATYGGYWYYDTTQTLDHESWGEERFILHLGDPSQGQHG